MKPKLSSRSAESAIVSRRKAGEWMHRFFTLALLVSALTAHAADAQVDPRLNTLK